MLRESLTGGIATGKSYVLDLFRSVGVPCLDADALAHGVHGRGHRGDRAAIAARFGADVLAADGAVDRTKARPDRVRRRAARRDLEAIVHPAVYRAIAAGLRRLRDRGGAARASSDMPLCTRPRVATSTSARDCHRHVRRELQMARLVERGLIEDAARQRLAAQWPTEKRPRAPTS